MTSILLLIALISSSCATTRVDADIPPKPTLEKPPSRKGLEAQTEREKRLWDIILAQDSVILKLLEWAEKVIVTNT